MDTEIPRTCGYARADGTHCPCPVEGEGELCFWHDQRVSKEGPGLKERLQEWARTGESMEGFVLRYADLEGIRLNDARGLNLSRAVLFRARLCGASMWNVDLRGADMMKTDLSGANLNEAKMQDVNLLGAELDGTKLERVQWGERAIQEKWAVEAETEGDLEKARDNYEEAEEVYRSLRRAYDHAGRFDDAGIFFRKEMTMRRKMMPQWSTSRVWSKLVDLFSGYGEEPQRVIGFSLLLVGLCAVFFFCVGVEGPDGRVGFDAGRDGLTNIVHFLDCLYFSIVTFTTLGYGDIMPTGVAKAVAALEAFSGAFMMALFVAVFGKKMTR